MMQWQQLLNPLRLQQAKAVRIEPGRSPFHKDYDRIIFSGSFRRLGRKTQVHPLTDNDHIHTRLSHSLEVASVGRSLGMMIAEHLSARLPANITVADFGTIVQAACLAHDIGNPPFGHAGEFAIRDWFKKTMHINPELFAPMTDAERRDLLNYEGNAQGFRVVTQLEYNQFHGGMQLTVATLGAMLKYPWTVEHALSNGKFGAYQSEKRILIQVAQTLGLIHIGETNQLCWCRHPLAYITEAADDLCYALLDLEDGLEMGILHFDEVAQVLGQIANLKNNDYFWQQLQQMRNSGVSQRRCIAALRGLAMERAVNALAMVFVDHEKDLLKGELAQELISYCASPIAQGVARAKTLARDRIFQNERKAKLEIGAYTTLGILLDDFINAAYELHTQGTSTFKYQRVLALIGENTPVKEWPLYLSYRRMLDFIGGMTDHYAVSLAQEMGGLL